MIVGTPIPLARAGLRLEPQSLARIAVASVAYYATTVLLLHGLRPDVDPIARVTSEYAVGRLGFLMSSTFLVLALALVSLSIALSRSWTVPIRSSAGLLLLLVAAGALVIAAVFPVDVGAIRPVTAAGWTHRLAATLVFPSLGGAAILLATRFRRTPGWGDLAGIGTALGAAVIALFAMIPLVLLERGVGGAAQRLVLALALAWIYVVARRAAGEGSELREAR